VSVAILILLLALAAANGANDVSKGVATLAGAGVARYRTAILWGTGTTFIGAIASAAFSDRLSALFSHGIVAAPATVPFAFAVLVGATAWVGLATAGRVPVSTTHAIVGALIGAGIVLEPAAVNWNVVLTNVAGPLLLSIGAGYGVSSALGALRFGRVECMCVDVANSPPQIVVSGDLAGLAPGLMLPMVAVTLGSSAACRAHNARRIRMTTTAAHWLTSGATGMARGLNDTPKIVAIGAFVIVPNGGDAHWLLGLVAAAMAVGGVVAGMRVARSLAENVVRMEHREGFQANLATALLVGAGAHLGLPMSTTHVATGAIAGLVRKDSSRLNRRTLRDFAIAWTLTPLCAGLISTLTLRLIS
jgi:inorganic phosphate transporter, PiT family